MQEKKFFNNFKSKLFPINTRDKIPTPESTPKLTPDPTVFDTPEPTPKPTPKPTKTQTRKSKHKTSLLRLHGHFLNKIKSYETNVNNEIFKEYFGYWNTSFLAKDVYKANQTKNEQMVNLVNYGLIDLRNAV